jgi:AbrB family looped-hinge helix DNA binding protein
MPKSTVTSKGQVTLPKELRDAHGIAAGTTLEFVDEGATIRLRVLGRAGALGALRDYAPRTPVSVAAMRAAIRRRAAAKRTPR